MDSPGGGVRGGLVTVHRLPLPAGLVGGGGHGGSSFRNPWAAWLRVQLSLTDAQPQEALGGLLGHPVLGHAEAREPARGFLSCRVGSQRELVAAVLALAPEQPEQTDVGDATGLHHRLLRHQALHQQADRGELQLKRAWPSAGAAAGPA